MAVTLSAALGGLKVLPSVLTMMETRRCARVAQDLATLRFWCDGMAAPLRHLAEGKCSQADLDEIDAGLKKTENETTKIARRLRKARDGVVATKLGMAVANDLDVVIYEKLGPGSIRPQLRHLVETQDCSADNAADLLRQIELFNEHLDQVHEVIRPKGQQIATTQARHRRGAAGKRPDATL
jgi:hypothetical protein